LNQTVLLGQFEEQKPMPGERIALRYYGKEDEPRGGGPGYHKFRLTVTSREPEMPKWLKAGDEPEAPSSVGGLPPGGLNKQIEAEVTEAEIIEERDALEGGETDDGVPY